MTESLFEIQSALVDLVTAREEAEAELDAALPERHAELARVIETCEEAIRDYVAREVRKVDGIRGYWRHCEMMAEAAEAEAKRQKERAEQWSSRLRRLKDSVCSVMRSFEWASKSKRLDGSTGSITLKQNGGVQPVEITDPGMIPPEFMLVTLRIRGHQLAAITETLADHDMQFTAEIVKSEPMMTAIRGELTSACAECDGTGVISEREIQCFACGGSGHRGVPGATLRERGWHVEVK